MQQVTSLQEIETVINQNGEMVIGKNSKNNVIIMSMEEYRNNVRMQMFRDLLMLIGHINRIIEQKAGEVCGSC